MGKHYTIINGFRVTRGDPIQVRFSKDGTWRPATFECCRLMYHGRKKERAIFIEGLGMGTGPTSYTGPYWMDEVRVDDELTMIARRLAR